MQSSTDSVALQRAWRGRRGRHRDLGDPDPSSHPFTFELFLRRWNSDASYHCHRSSLSAGARVCMLDCILCGDSEGVVATSVWGNGSCGLARRKQ